MGTAGAESKITVTYVSALASDRPTGRPAIPMHLVMSIFTLVALSGAAIGRGGTYDRAFAAVAAGAAVVGVAAVVARVLREPVRPAGDRVTVTFTRLGLAVDRADGRQSIAWSLVRSVARRSGSWEFDLSPAPALLVPESAFDDEQANVLTRLVQGKGLLRT